MNMKKMIQKLALGGAILAFPMPMNAQDNFSTLYGTYTGSMTTTIYSDENPNGIALSNKNVSFDLSKGENDFYTLALKGYSLANKYHFADILLTDNHIIKDGEDWKIEQINYAFGQFLTSDGTYLVSLVFALPNTKPQTITATGEMQLSLFVKYTESKIEHVFKGKKVSNATGISNVSPDSQQPKVYYDLQGRRVEKPGHGIYIVNGKKIVL